MRSRLLSNPFPVIALALGALMTIGVSYWESLAFAREFPGQAGEDGSWLPAAVFLFLPFAGLALLGSRARPVVAYGALVILLALGAGFWGAAGSDPQGALVILTVWPLQWLVAGLTALRRLRRPMRTGPGTPSDAERHRPNRGRAR